MGLVYISTIKLLLLALSTSALGMAIGWYWKKRTEGTWKEDFKALQKENSLITKASKKAKKDNNKLKKQVETWKAKTAKLEEEYPVQIEDLKAQLKIANIDSLDKDKIIRQLETDKQRAIQDFERLEKAHVRLNAKYKEDLADLKDWRSNRDKFNRTTKDLKGKLKVANEKIARLTTQNEKLAKEIEENNAFVSKLRALKARNSKLTEDLKYWEKKHYDTHHELAGIKDRIPELEAQIQTLETQNQTVTQNNAQMEQKVLEFKTRFVNMNNKYHQLVENQ